MSTNLFLSFFSLLQSLLFLSTSSASAAPVGICYGRIGDNLPPPSRIADIIKSNQISNIRIFDADPTTLRSFYGTGIKLMIGVPNEILQSLASTPPYAALDWLQNNVFAYVPPDNVRYIAVGNEVFLYDLSFSPYLVPAILNLYQALQTLGLSSTIKLSSPQAASVLLNSYPPSSGSFHPNLRSTMLPLLQFLHETQSAFMINVYPYITYTNDINHVSLDYALFRANAEEIVRDGTLVYDNLFDASIDALVYAMEREGYGHVPVVVAETGWPTSGGEAASMENALTYNENVVRRALSGIGTPRRARQGVEAYLFDLFDENGKSGKEYEKHFGIFGIDGFKTYNLSFIGSLDG